MLRGGGRGYGTTSSSVCKNKKMTGKEKEGNSIGESILFLLGHASYELFEKRTLEFFDNSLRSQSGRPHLKGYSDRVVGTLSWISQPPTPPSLYDMYDDAYILF